MNHQEEIDQAVAAHALRKIVHTCLDRMASYKLHRKWFLTADPAQVVDDLATYDGELKEYYDDPSPLIPFVREWQDSAHV